MSDEFGVSHFELIILLNNTHVENVNETIQEKNKCEKDRESEKDRVMWWVKITSGLSLTEEVELSVCLDF